jgi:hypothetical protein
LPVVSKSEESFLAEKLAERIVFWFLQPDVL